jgi:hypothetical protein
MKPVHALSSCFQDSFNTVLPPTPISMSDVIVSANDKSMGKKAIRLSEFVPTTDDVLKGVESN